METMKFTDDEGIEFDLNDKVYRPEQRDVNHLIRKSVGQQLVRGAFTDF